MRVNQITLWRIFILVGIVALVAAFLQPRTMKANEPNKESSVTLNPLTPEEAHVIRDKGTEMPFTGKYYKFSEKGTYTCKQCGAALYRSSDKFDAGCGWPSFDDEITDAVKRTTDADGFRTEITCARCGAHLGHVFEGEGFTAKDTRHCVNSISLNFVPDSAQVASVSATGDTQTQTAYFAGGCFWGTEYFLQQAPGVVSAKVGYMGGHTDNPTYHDVCGHGTGHAEAVEVVFDPTKTTYEALAKLFFEIHDPTQLDHQGPDYGDQYRSEIFYVDDMQKETADKLIGILKGKGLKVVTKVEKAGPFWVAEDYHQNYYKSNGHEPYCHMYTKRF